MSVQVAAINLSAATVGTAGAIRWGQLAKPPSIAEQMQPQQPHATLLVFNESGCWLTCLFPYSRETFTVPAGAWRKLYPPPGESELDYVVGNVVGGAPAPTLYADYYAPGEPVDDLGILGNSPIGVTGAVSTSGAAGTSFVKNDGNAPATSIIESTPSDQGSSSTSINNDGSGFWRILSANVLRGVVNVVRGTSGAVKAAITLGDSGDATITTLYGGVQGGQPATLGAATVGALTGTGANSLDGGALTTDGAGNATAASVTATNAGHSKLGADATAHPALIWDTVAYNGETAATVSDRITKGGGTAVDRRITNLSGGFVYVEGLNSSAHFDADAGLQLGTGGTVKGWSLFSGSGSGTFNHGLGTTPRGVIVCPNSGVDSSYTVGVDHIGATQCHVNIGGDQNVPWFGVAFA